MVCKTQCKFWKKDWISNTSRLVKKTDFNTESTEVKNYIPSITVLATNAALKCVWLSG